MALSVSPVNPDTLDHACLKSHDTIERKEGKCDTHVHTYLNTIERMREV